MLDRVLRIIITLLMAVAGAALLHLATPFVTAFISTEILKVDMGFFRLTLASMLCLLAGAALGAIIGLFLSRIIIGQLKRFAALVESQFSKMPIHDVVAGACGLAIGLIIANLLSYSFAKIPVVGDYIPLVFSIMLGYLGIHVTIRKRKEIFGIFEVIPKTLKELVKLKEKEKAEESPKETSSEPRPVDSVKLYKLLDTSVIIDGRIADICETGFLEGTLLIPVFVLEELQHIADSSDVLKRTKGRRGLDILQRIRTHSGKLSVEVTNVDFEDISEVDSKLVRLAQQVNGKIVTNDFNLNKVAQLRGVEVLNINELSNAVKPVVIPGEVMQVTVVKDGKEQGQGVAYLDDGTMIVVENGRRHLNSTIRVEVTSALQTAAGRMIFAKPKL